MAATEARLVRLIARHFDDLKGLERAPVALALGGGAWAWSSTGSVFATLLAVGAGLMAGVIAYVFVADTYRQLGRVAPSRRARMAAAAIGTATIPIMRLQTAFIPGPSVVWLGFGLYSLWLLIDGWPWRWYHAFTCASAVYVAFGRTSLAHPTDFAWMAPRLWLFALTLLLTGIADHSLLVHSMRAGRSESQLMADDADTI